MHLPLGLDRERRGSLIDRAQEEDEACRGLGLLPAVLCDDSRPENTQSENQECFRCHFSVSWNSK